MMQSDAKQFCGTNTARYRPGRNEKHAVHNKSVACPADYLTQQQRGRESHADEYPGNEY